MHLAKQSHMRYVQGAHASPVSHISSPHVLSTFPFTSGVTASQPVPDSPLPATPSNSQAAALLMPTLTSKIQGCFHCKVPIYSHSYAFVKPVKLGHPFYWVSFVFLFSLFVFLSVVPLTLFPP